MSHEETLKAYGLPSEEELKLELGPIDKEEEDILVDLIDKLQSKTRKYTIFFEEMLHPDSNIISMQESSMFSNEQREQMFDLFRALTLYQRKILLIRLSTEEKDKAEYFKEFYAFWLSKKEEIKSYVTQALEVWNGKEIPKVKTQGYFG